jgi:hypothetical protein
LTISGASNSNSDTDAAVSLLFSPGDRPTAHAIRAHLAESAEFAVSFDPAEGDRDAPAEAHWIELLASGLTFDLGGLAPGPAAVAPPRKRSSAPEGDGADRLEALTLRPGPHLAGGIGMVPVIRMLAWLGAGLAGLKGTEAVAWHSARCWSAPEVYVDGVRRWVEGGVFPGLTLASLSLSPDMGLHSEGLALFTGQELRIEPELVDDRAEAAKLAVRLLDYLIERGWIAAPESIVGPDGAPLRLEPSANGRFVRICRG